MPVGYVCYAEFPLPKSARFGGRLWGPVLPMREHYKIIRMVVKKKGGPNMDHASKKISINQVFKMSKRNLRT